MGNSSSKDERRPSRPDTIRHVSASDGPGPTSSPPPQQTPADRLASHIYGSRNVAGRGSRPDLAFLGIGRDRGDETPPPERIRETKQEKEARKLERDRQARVKERERSIREEGVDGGYLVTLGTYTGAEDFNKSIVRQLQLERRMAPFWQGLNDHSESWTEAQLVAAVRGQPIPAADEVPADMARTASQASTNPRGSELNLNSLMVPITSRSQSYQSEASANLSASHPAFSTSGPATPTSSSALLRGRAKTLASLATGKGSSSDLTMREIQLPKDPYVNGLPLEAYLYREVSECPICFLYYPPYLNRTRCCDQPICSECFVQIKRPDPHPPEHEQPGQPRQPEEEAEMLVSEIASCPFCVTPEFGVTYEAPPLRRGLAYANTANSHPLRNLNSAMSSSSSLQSGGVGTRRRAASLSATSSQVITTDKVRPDWAKKLSDARAHALRRSAAATALHNAAYVLGNQGDGQIRGGLTFGRRRRTLFGDSPSASGSGTPQFPDDSTGELFSGRSSSRRTRVDDLEDLMMMEAIRLSLAAEEDRKRREEKDAHKGAKKRAKEEKKQAKQADKLAKKRNGSGASLYLASTNDSTSSWAGTSMARSTSNIGAQASIPEEQVHGKGKAPAQDFAGFNPLLEPTSTLNTNFRDEHRDQSGSPSPSSIPLHNPIEHPQAHLEASRANLQPAGSSPFPTPGSRSPHLRQLSEASSAASSFVDTPPGSLPAMDANFASGSGSNLDLTPLGAPDSNIPTPAAGTTPSGEPMFNFRSLAAMIGAEEDTDTEKAARGSEHIEHYADPASRAEEELKEPSPTGSPPASLSPTSHFEGNRSRGDSGESSSSAPPPIYVEHAEEGEDAIEPVPPPSASVLRTVADTKDYGGVNVFGHEHVQAHEATQ